MKGLAAGTSEFKKAASELNGEVSSLVEQYPELAKYVDSSKGYLDFKTDENSKKGIEKILNDYQDNSIKAQSASTAAKLQKQQAQQVVDFQNLNHESKLIKTRKLTDEEIDKIYGKGTGKAAGAKLAGAATTQIDKEGTDEIARAIANGEHIEYMKDDGTFQEDSKFAYLESKDSEAFASLKKYGEGLIADDAAAKVFTDSLLSNAAIISDVSEEQKSNMTNFFNSDQVESILETEKTNLKEMDEAKWEEQKEAYAKAMGYTYSDGNIYKGEAIAANKLDLSKDSLIEQIVGMNVTESISGTMDKLAPK